MKKITVALLGAVMALSAITSAQAEPGHHHSRGGYYQPQHRYEEHHRHSHSRHNWIGPAALLALGGLTIGTIVHQQQVPQAIYNQPPPPSGNWYYCGSSGQYYPYTQACPEGWQAVPPR